MLTKTQKKYLAGICHHLKPVVMTGQKGMTEAVMEELIIALDHHELIKVRLRGDRDDRREWTDAIVKATGAEVVQSIGQTACFYRRNAKSPRLELPA